MKDRPFVSEQRQRSLENRLVSLQLSLEAQEERNEREELALENARKLLQVLAGRSSEKCRQCRLPLNTQNLADAYDCRDCISGLDRKGGKVGAGLELELEPGDTGIELEPERKKK